MAKMFNLILLGRPLAGLSRENVAASLSATLRIPEERALELLAGRETIVKRGLSEAALKPYLEALRKCGAEVRAEEVGAPAAAPAAAMTPHAAPAVPAPAAAPVATMKCPACGADQPKRTLCRQCGVDMKRLLAAQEEAKRAAPPPSAATAAIVTRTYEDSLDKPLYRRTLGIEILCFIVLTPLWGWFAMLDSARGKRVRALGAAVFAVSAVWIILGLLVRVGVIGMSEEEEAIADAVVYAAKTADAVSEYAVANQRLPERTASIELPDGRPPIVKAVAVGSEGEVRVTLIDELKKAGGGAIIYRPRVEAGKLLWSCQIEGVSYRAIRKMCE